MSTWWIISNLLDFILIPSDTEIILNPFSKFTKLHKITFGTAVGRMEQLILRHEAGRLIAATVEHAAAAAEIKNLTKRQTAF
jgi:hypothetical protein